MSKLYCFYLSHNNVPNNEVSLKKEEYLFVCFEERLKKYFATVNR